MVVPSTIMMKRTWTSWPRSWRVRASARSITKVRFVVWDVGGWERGRRTDCEHGHEEEPRYHARDELPTSGGSADIRHAAPSLVLVADPRALAPWVLRLPPPVPAAPSSLLDFIAEYLCLRVYAASMLDLDVCGVAVRDV
jgi:hypothetical protein